MVPSADHAASLAPNLERNGHPDAVRLAYVAGTYRERPAVTSLRDAVQCVWSNALRAQPGRLRVIPDGCTDVLWVNGSLVLAGPDTGPVIERVDPSTTIVGVRFRPGVAGHALRATMSHFVNRRVLLEEIVGTRARQLREEVGDCQTVAEIEVKLESFVEHSLRDASRFADSLRWAAWLRARARAADLRELVRQSGQSERTIRRRSHDLFGYGPKTLGRVLRFQQFVALSQGDRCGGLSLARRAAACGYADQAHLSREVRALSGMTPAALVAQLHAVG